MMKAEETKFALKRVCVGLLLLFLFACSKKPENVNDEFLTGTSGKPVQTDLSLSKPTTDSKTTLKGTCVLRPEQVVKIKSQIGGEIKRVNVQQGESVKRGDILAVLETENLMLRKERSIIELEKYSNRRELLQFQVSKAEKELAVVKELGGNVPNNARYAKEMASLIERKTELNDNEMNIKLSQLDLKTIEVQIRKSSIVAPMNGIVLMRSVEPGSVVGSGVESVAGSEVLFELADPSKLQAACIIKEADATFLRIGLASKVVIDGKSESNVKGKVIRISPIISNSSGISRREFFIELENLATSQLLPGMNATVEIEL